MNSIEVLEALKKAIKHIKKIQWTHSDAKILKELNEIVTKIEGDKKDENT